MGDPNRVDSARRLRGCVSPAVFRSAPRLGPPGRGDRALQVAPRRGVGLLIAVVLSLIPASGAAYNVYYDMEVPPGIGYGVIGLALGQAVDVGLSVVRLTGIYSRA